MKQRIIETISALLIVATIVSLYINAIWPNTIGFINSLAGFFLITAVSSCWLTLYPKWYKLRYIALIIVGTIVLVIVPTAVIEGHFIKKDRHIQVGYIFSKDKGHRSTRGGYTPDIITIGANSSICASNYVEKDIFNKLNIGDTLIIKVSSQGGIYINKLFPMHEEIERYKVPQHYINGKLQEKPSYEQYSAAVRDSLLQRSHKQVGYVYEKLDDEYYRHLVKVGIDANHTTTHEFYETDRNYTKVYKRLLVGDTVILQVADSLPEINHVLCWQPDENDIANYATYEAIKDYSNCSKEFEKEKLLNSHNRKAIVYDKYEDEHVGAYLEVGIDEKHVRTYIFKTYSKEFKHIYQVVNVGDTVIAQVSDEIPQLNRVVNWQTTTDGEKDNHLQDEYTYVTIANVKSKETREEYLGRSYRKGTFYYVKLKIGNKMETNYVKIKSTRHRQIFESLHEGDSVLVKMTEGKTKTVDVLNWHPTPEEIEKYKTPVRVIEKNR